MAFGFRKRKDERPRVVVRCHICGRPTGRKMIKGDSGVGTCNKCFTGNIAEEEGLRIPNYQGNKLLRRLM